MELYLAAAAAFLLPLLLQCWLLPLGRRRPRLRFTRWLPLLGSAVFAALALSAAGENGIFRGLAVLAYGALAALILLRRPLGVLARLAARTAAGLAGLFAFSQVGSLIGVSLGVNLVNALVLGVLGVPGFGLLLMLNWALAV